MKRIKRIKSIIAAIGVSIVAFFELCLTGRAVRAWRIARTDGNHSALYKRSGAGLANSTFPPDPAPIFRLFVTAAIAGIAIAAALYVARPNGQLGDGVLYGASIETPATATEGQSPTSDRAAGLAVHGCIVFSAVVVIANFRRISRKESQYDKEGKINR